MVTNIRNYVYAFHTRSTFAGLPKLVKHVMKQTPMVALMKQAFIKQML